MKIIKITREKKDNLTGFCEKVLHYGEKMLSCLETLQDDEDDEFEDDEFEDEDDEFNERMGRRGGRMGMRTSRRMATAVGDRFDPDVRRMYGYNERRGVKGTGRYSRM